MFAYIVRRILSIIPTLLLVATLVFVLLRLAPGGPYDTERALPPEVMKNILKQHKLDDPLWVQYKDWLVRLLTEGSLGFSTKYPNRTV